MNGRFAAVSAGALMFAALGTTPLVQAAERLVVPTNSVGTPQLKAGAVTAAKIKNGTLTAAKFAPGQLQPGPQGPKGDAGEQGAPGAQGPKGDPGTTNTVVRTASKSISVGPSSEELAASCLPGERATGGGGAFVTSSVGDAIVYSAPGGSNGLTGNGDTPTKWWVGAHNGAAYVKTFVVYVVCSAA